MHGDVGQTQFMPKNIPAYGIGNSDVAANTLNSTANFLTANSWRTGAGYSQPNFAAIEATWNAAGVYQKAIAIMERQIEGVLLGQRRLCAGSNRSIAHIRRDH